MNTIGQSTLFNRPTSFENALVQSIVGGNTMVFNRASKLLIETVGVVPTPSHDWWLYLLISGAGGKVFYDAKPLVLYRQHANSIVGENISLLNIFMRLLRLLSGVFKKWTNSNIICLQKAKFFLSSSAFESLLYFENSRRLHFADKLLYLPSLKFYRMTKFQNFIMKFAFLINKI